MTAKAALARRVACLLACAFAAAVAAAPIGVEPQLSIRDAHEPYYVSAGNATELRERMKIGRGEWAHARGLTRGRLVVTRNLTQEMDRCIVNSVAIEVEITTTLPEWDPAARMPPELRERWETFRASIARHEDSHRDNLTEAAFALRDEIATLQPQSSCMKVEAQLKRMVARADMKRRLADEMLDRHVIAPGAM